MVLSVPVRLDLCVEDEPHTHFTAHVPGACHSARHTGRGTTSRDAAREKGQGPGTYIADEPNEST